MSELEIRHPFVTPAPVHYKRNRKVEMKVGTWNTRTCSSGFLPLIAEDLDRLGMDICLLQETRLRGNETFALPGGKFIIITSSSTEDGHYGVGIAVRKDIFGLVEKITRISERLMTIELNTAPIRTALICAYAPTTSHTEEERNGFFDLLNRTIEDTPKSHFLVVGGDLNVQLAPLEGVCGKYTPSRVLREESAALLSILGAQNMVVANTFFKPKRSGRLYTYEGSFGRTQIDFLIVRKRFMSSIRYCRAIRRTLHDSDHNVVTMKLKLKLKRFNPRPEGNPRLDMEALRIPSVRKAFRQELSVAVASTNCENDWTSGRKRIVRAAEKAIPKQPRKRFPWMSDETLKLAKVYQQYRLDRAAPVLIRAARAAFRASKKADEIKRWTKYAERLEAAHERKDQKTLYTQIRQLRRRQLVPIPAHELAETFKLKLGGEAEDSASSVTHALEYSESDLPTRMEISRAIKKLKKGKAPGPDSISAEILLAGGPLIVDLLVPIIVHFWKTGEIPTEIGEASVVPLFKGGNPDDRDRYRPVALLNTLFKIIELLLLPRIEPYIRVDSEQCGFVRGKSTIDAIASLRNIAQVRSERQLPIWMCAVDFSNAFDSVIREKVWSDLKAAGASSHHVSLLHFLYNSVSFRVSTQTSTSEPYGSQNGCPQGSSLGPKLFLVAMQHILERVRAEAGHERISMNGGSIFYIAYADDLVLISASSSGLQKLIDSTCSSALSYGLCVNPSKTVLLTTECAPSGLVRIGDLPLCPASHMNYLGSFVDARGNSSLDIGNRIRKAFLACRSLFRSCFGLKRLPLGLRSRVYRSTIQPILTYSSETWTSLSADLRRLDCYERATLRRFFPVKLMRYPSGQIGPRMIANAELYHDTRIQPCSELVTKERWSFIHRVCNSATEIVPLKCIT